MDDLINSITGGISTGMFFSYLFFVLIGAAINIYMDIDTRDVESKNTPKKFSWKFNFLDNRKRYFATLLLIYVGIRFFEQMNGSPLTEYTALLMGFSFDRISQFGKKTSNILKEDRKKLLNYEEDEE
jgi:hypothetical protein